MKQEDIEKFVRNASKGDTAQVEALFMKPGGRKFFETTILLLVNNLPISKWEKLDYMQSFLQVLDNLEERITHQKRGDKILKTVLNDIE